MNKILKTLAALICILIFAAQIGVAENTHFPSIPDKLAYGKNITTSPPVPEVHMSQLIVSQSWLGHNDEDLRPDMIKVTFPSNWIRSPQATKNIAVLRMPTSLFDQLDMDDDPSTITISQSAQSFVFYPSISDFEKRRQEMANANRPEDFVPQTILPALPGLDSPQVERMVSAVKPEYNVYIEHGFIQPYYFVKPGNPDFTNFNEREILLNGEGDVIEIISQFWSGDTTNGGIWAAIYDNWSWITPGGWVGLNIPLSNIRAVEYFVIIDGGDPGGRYNVYFRDTYTGTWYTGQYLDSSNIIGSHDVSSTKIDYITGSTELYYDREGDFTTLTYPIIDTEMCYTSISYCVRPVNVLGALNYYEPFINKRYVDINGAFNPDGTLTTAHSAGSSIT